MIFSLGPDIPKLFLPPQKRKDKQMSLKNSEAIRPEIVINK